MELGNTTSSEIGCNDDDHRQSKLATRPHHGWRNGNIPSLIH